MRFVRRGTVPKIAACCCVVVLLVTWYVLNVERDLDKSLKIEIIERSIRSAVNRGECRHPHLPLDNPDIMKFYKPVERINCGEGMDWVMCEKSICFVRPEIASSHEDVICSYTDIIRKSDYKVRFGQSLRMKEPYVLQASDFVKVVCRSSSGESWFGMAHGIRDTVPRPPASNFSPNLAVLPPEAVAQAQQQMQDGATAPFYNVLMFGFDSLSRNAFIRKLPRTYEYLTQQLGATVLKGYNIVGDGTPQALVPLLTGFTELELPETRKRLSGAGSVDSYPMIWKDFARLGYMTSFNEDLPNVGTFTYRMTGFEAQPVDHYLRTYYVQAEHMAAESKPNCIGHQPDHITMLEYTKNFMLKYRDAPRFAFSFHGGLSHDSINLVGAADDDVHDWLVALKERSLLDDTILIMMADHGNRFAEVRATLQGKQEERLPFFSFVFPESFKKRFPQEYKNFLANEHHLTTPFDIHATLKHVIQLQTAVDQFGEINDPKTETSPPGIRISELARGRAMSLLDPIPSNRSCADAYIEPHWCACLNWLPLQLNDSRYTGIILKAAQSIVNAINLATVEQRQYCAPLEIHRVNWALRLQPHKELLQFKTNSDRDGFLADMTGQTLVRDEMYQLQVVTMPGEGLFEASVAYSLHTFSATTKLTDISRVNKYGNQARCIYDRDPELRKYCYCRD
uniref:SD01790p n=1 Tax=Drosophila melanogaster TaxID=7227 RepID=Q95TI3_DROME|nr:SD01790p [Drosophila melanogaster]